ncbi:MAG: hypothetical protein KDK51_01265 [Deltaproteobacteria bacterium]|nr:hypothetical protein [Deltaproteobacteria bacterium]
MKKSLFVFVVGLYCSVFAGPPLKMDLVINMCDQYATVNNSKNSDVLIYLVVQAPEDESILFEDVKPAIGEILDHRCMLRGINMIQKNSRYEKIIYESCGSYGVVDGTEYNGNEVENQMFAFRKSLQLACYEEAIVEMNFAILNDIKNKCASSGTNDSKISCYKQYLNKIK